MEILNPVADQLTTVAYSFLICIYVCVIGGVGYMKGRSFYAIQLSERLMRCLVPL